MEKQFYDTLRLGVLGGGQLGRMLLQKAADYNISNVVLDPDEEAPCKNITDKFYHGSFADYDAVLEVGKNVDLLTIEIEHVNIEALEALEKRGLKIFPWPSIIKMVQDKGLQKIFYRANKIPTAEFKLIEHKDEITEADLPVVQKLRKGGYDGKGVQVIRNREDLSKAFAQPSVLEKLIDFEKELAVIVARNSDGHIETFPAVEMVFNPEANLVEYLFSPANIKASVASDAEHIARTIAQASKIVGVLAVEMFLTKTGELLVNEIAPRPHNSGHQTIEGNVTSQYEQHLRAILNLPLGNTDIVKPAVMVNLLGEKGHTGHAHYEGIEKVLAMPQVYIHLYGKKLTKPFRKMGHVTCLGATVEEAMAKARTVSAIIKVISKDSSA